MMRHKSKRQRGMSFIEVMVALALMAIGIFLLFDVGLQSSRLAAKVDQRNSTLGSSRSGFEMMARDIKLADRILTQYPLTGTPSYRADDNTTLIIQIPDATTNGDPIPNQWRVIIYRLNVPQGAQTQNGDYAQGYPLERFLSTITGNVAGPITRDRVVAKGVTHLSLGFMNRMMLEGNDSQTAFGIEGTPIGNGMGLTQQVNVNGVNWLGTMASLTTSQVTFVRPPRGGALIDVMYRINPRTPTSADMANPASLVQLRMRARATWTDRRETRKTDFLEYSSRVTMLNR